MSGTPQVFSYKPALLRRAVDWQLDGVTLAGPDRSVSLSDVTGVNLTDLTAKGQLMRSLVLDHPEGPVALALNIAETVPPQDPDRATHRALCSAVARTLAEANPDLTVTLGARGGAKWAMFLIGVASLLFGLGIGVAAALSGISGDRMAAAAAPMLALVVLGVVLVRSNAPWKDQPTLPVSLLPVMLDALDGTTPRAPSDPGGVAPS